MRPVITTNTDDHIGLAVIRSLGRNNIDFNVVTKTKNTLGLYSRYCRNTTVSPFDMNYFSRLSPDDIVFPMIEDTMLYLLKNRGNLTCRLGFADYETIEKARDKAMLMKHAMDQKIPCPRTFFITSPSDIADCKKEMVFPVVVKPSRGSGGKGIQFIDTPDQFPAITKKFLEQNGPVLVQEKLPFTTKYTVGALFNSDHKMRRVCVIRELRNYPIETGQACYVETVDYPLLVSLTEKILQSLDFFGVADIDFIVDQRDNRPKLMEINPRFWGSMQVAIDAGVDFPRDLFRMLKDGDIETSLSYKTGVRCRYVLYNDLFRLIKFLKGDHSLRDKSRAIAEFLDIHQDQGYYIFSSDDMLPVLGLTSIKIMKKWNLFRGRS